MRGAAVNMDLVRQLPGKRDALRACALYSGKKLKTIGYELDIDPGHLSKMLNPGEDPRHFPPEKENLFMDVCGNEIPLLWALMSRGYQPPAALQECQLENQLLRQENARLTAEIERLRSDQSHVVNIFKNLEVR